MFQGQCSHTRCAVLGTLILFLVATAAFAQTATNQTLTNPTPSDARMNQFDDPTGASWRVFAVDSMPGGPLAIVQVEEVRQHNPPSRWGVSVLNRGLMPVNSLTLAAAIVDSNGRVKATQPLGAIKNMAPGQVQRREMRVMATVLAPTDRVVFFVKDVISEIANYKAVDAEVAALIKIGAARLPVP